MHHQVLWVYVQHPVIFFPAAPVAVHQEPQEALFFRRFFALETASEKKNKPFRFFEREKKKTVRSQKQKLYTLEKVGPRPLLD